MTGTFTDPKLALTVPCAQIFLAHTGNFISVSVATTRTPASMISAITPRALSDVANKSPKYPSLQGELGATTSTSPGLHTSTATWIIQLSPGGTKTVTAGPASDGPGEKGRIYGASNPGRPWDSG